MKVNRTIVFKGIDSWNRPVYKVLEQNYYIGSVNKLFDFSTSKEEVDNYFRNNLNELVYFGNKFGCEPNGTPLKKEIILTIK